MPARVARFGPQFDRELREPTRDHRQPSRPARLRAVRTSCHSFPTNSRVSRGRAPCPRRSARHANPGGAYEARGRCEPARGPACMSAELTEFSNGVRPACDRADRVANGDRDGAYHAIADCRSAVAGDPGAERGPGPHPAQGAATMTTQQLLQVVSRAGLGSAVGVHPVAEQDQQRQSPSDGRRAQQCPEQAPVRYRRSSADGELGEHLLHRIHHAWHRFKELPQQADRHHPANTEHTDGGDESPKRSHGQPVRGSPVPAVPKCDQNEENRGGANGVTDVEGPAGVDQRVDQQHARSDRGYPPRSRSPPPQGVSDQESDGQFPDDDCKPVHR